MTFLSQEWITNFFIEDLVPAIIGSILAISLLKLGIWIFRRARRPVLMWGGEKMLRLVASIMYLTERLDERGGIAAEVAHITSVFIAIGSLAAIFVTSLLSCLIIFSMGTTASDNVAPIALSCVLMSFYYLCKMAARGLCIYKFYLGDHAEESLQRARATSQKKEVVSQMLSDLLGI